jgi:hypothetical protein
MELGGKINCSYTRHHASTHCIPRPVQLRDVHVSLGGSTGVIYVDLVVQPHAWLIGAHNYTIITREGRPEAQQ